MTGCNVDSNMDNCEVSPSNTLSKVNVLIPSPLLEAFDWAGAIASTVVAFRTEKVSGSSPSLSISSSDYYQKLGSTNKQNSGLVRKFLITSHAYKKVMDRERTGGLFGFIH